LTVTVACHTIRAFPRVGRGGMGKHDGKVAFITGLKAFTDGRGGSDAYAAAKSAIVTLVKGYAAYLGPHNVRINAIAPTGVQRR
jgi:NAD(P)-dependent dehydrogenase (short-subunit alcohol dehydrogenase family)